MLKGVVLILGYPESRETPAFSNKGEVILPGSLRQIKEDCLADLLAGWPFNPPPPSSWLPPCSVPSVIHYSFDMAQQVHYPSDHLQPVPIYYPTEM